MKKIPELKPRQVVSELTHHSANVDWDWVAAYWSLVTDQIVSAPKSLKITNAITAKPVGGICKYAGTTALNQGRIVSWARATSMFYRSPIFMFRDQSPVGQALSNNYYGLATYLNTVALRKNVNGSEGNVMSSDYYDTYTPANNTWYKHRVTWWETGGVLYVRLERYVDDAWVQICDELFDANNLWSGNEVNRCGVASMLFHTGTGYIWFDDTEVWGP